MIVLVEKSFNFDFKKLVTTHIYYLGICNIDSRLYVLNLFPRLYFIVMSIALDTISLRIFSSGDGKS